MVDFFDATLVFNTYTLFFYGSPDYKNTNLHNGKMVLTTKKYSAHAEYFLHFVRNRRFFLAGGGSTPPLIADMSNKNFRFFSPPAPICVPTYIRYIYPLKNVQNIQRISAQHTVGKFSRAGNYIPSPVRVLIPANRVDFQRGYF